MCALGEHWACPEPYVVQPAGQVAHAAEPLCALYFPAGQLRHWTRWCAYVPAEHVWHLGLLAEGWYHPPGQLLHALLAYGRYVPAAHAPPPPSCSSCATQHW